MSQLPWSSNSPLNCLELMISPLWLSKSVRLSSHLQIGEVKLAIKRPGCVIAYITNHILFVAFVIVQWRQALFESPSSHTRCSTAAFFKKAKANNCRSPFTASMSAYRFPFWVWLHDNEAHGSKADWQLRLRFLTFAVSAPQPHRSCFCWGLFFNSTPKSESDIFR